MKRLDWFLGVLIVSVAIIIGGLLASPTIKVSGPAGISTLQVGAVETIPVRLVGISLSSWSQAVPVYVENPITIEEGLK